MINAVQNLVNEVVLGAAFGVNDENDWIPAGYTYLAQLMTHDMSFRSSAIAAQPRAQAVNMRTPALDLDTIYRGGPEASPMLYQLSSQDTSKRAQLRVGRTIDGGDQDFGDIPRVCMNAADHNIADVINNFEYKQDCILKVDSVGQISATCRGNSEHNYFESLLGDPRNEDTLILSQLTLVFIKLHNKIVTILTEKMPHLTPRETFTEARNLTTLTYRNIILKDLLFRILDPSIYREFVARKRVSGARSNLQSRAQPEQFDVQRIFAYAAMRTGHAMVRHKYQLNDELTGDNEEVPLSTLLKFNRHQSIGKTVTIPIRSDWKIDWAFFFPKVFASGPNVGVPRSSKYNRSNKISPDYAKSLLSGSFNFDEWTGTKWDKGLLFSDVFRSESENIATGQEYVNYLINHRKINVPMISTKEIRNRIHNNGRNLNKKELNRFVNRTPLSLYFLIEAQLQGDAGRHMGPAGSIAIADAVVESLTPVKLNSDTDRRINLVFGIQGLPRWMPDIIQFMKGER